MSNVQLYLSIGIPTFTVILALLIASFQNDGLSDKVDRLADKMDQKLDRLADKVDRNNADHHRDFVLLMEPIVRLNERIAKVEN